MPREIHHISSRPVALAIAIALASSRESMIIRSLRGARARGRAGER
jgi:hypothetical protein